MENMANPSMHQSAGHPLALMRIDPYSISERVTCTRADGTSYTIDRAGVSFKHVMRRSGLRVSVALPSNAFKGVAARIVEHGEGCHTVILELHHHDPELCVPVLVADDLDDIAADWHSWSRIMKLPMLMIGMDNVAEPVRQELGLVMIEDPAARRKRITQPRHRPWFLRLRKKGSIGPVERIGAEEIIARN